ncbi:MAG TPA: hypothetical protein VF491_21700 [Vicinamibacterales bacterium]|jgi:hypothetical protein
MPKKAVSVTLDEANVLWLKGRARVSGGNVSEALDRVITQVRTGGKGSGGSWPSLVGTIDLGDDPDLLQADDAVRAWFAESINRPFEVNEDPSASRRRKVSGKKKSRG